MFLSIEELAIIYNKIIDGTATMQEVGDYMHAFKISCMKKEALVIFVEKKAAELRRKL